MRTAIVLPALVSVLAGAPAIKTVFPPGVKPVGPYTPGLSTSDMLYVSGQGARDASGKLPDTFDAQVRQCLENVKAVLQTGGLKTDHVVFTQVYLADIKNYEAMNRIYAEYFPKNQPARSAIGVARMPTGTPVEIAAIAVRDQGKKKTLSLPGLTLPAPVSPAVQVGSRVYLTGALGRDLKTGEVAKDSKAQIKLIMDRSEAILKSAGLEMRHLIYATVYVSPEMPMKVLAEAIDEYLPDETAKTIVQTAALPFGATIQISGVASREIKRLGHCTAIGNTIYCAARSGTVKQALESLKGDLEANRLSFNNVVATTVYLDDIDEFAAMNKVYATFFGKVPPTRTTVQPWKKVTELSLPPTTGVATPQDDSPRAQVSLIAVQ